MERQQRTIAKEVEFSGIGIHTCADVLLRFCPAPEGAGIVFRRIDLPDNSEIPAHVEYVVDTSRSTTLGKGEVVIHTVEHVLAAVRAFRLDNLVIELSNLEPPVADGSSLTFVEMIDQAGVVEQREAAKVYRLDEPLYYSQDPIHLVALPHDGFKISYTLHYPDSKALGAQYASFEITEETFRTEIAPCRTFSKYEEVAFLMKQGLIKGASLRNGVVVKDDAVLSQGGLRFPNEMARHKLLDMVGDFSLFGCEVHAHFIGIRAGHPPNFSLAKKVFQHMMREPSSKTKKQAVSHV